MLTECKNRDFPIIEKLQTTCAIDEQCYIYQQFLLKNYHVKFPNINLVWLKLDTVLKHCIQTSKPFSN